MMDHERREAMSEPTTPAVDEIVSVLAGEREAAQVMNDAAAARTLVDAYRDDGRDVALVSRTQRPAHTGPWRESS